MTIFDGQIEVAMNLWVPSMVLNESHFRVIAASFGT